MNYSSGKLVIIGIMNIAMEKGVINPEAYPFGKRKYVT
jgi:hypothetical protein